MSKPEQFKFDSRVRQRLLRSGVLSRAEVDEHIQALPDLDGEYELLSDIPQPAVSPAKQETYEEPILFDGGRGLHSLSESAGGGASSREGMAPAAAAGPSEGLRSALNSSLENEISGVGVGAVSAALGAMAAESGGSLPAGLAQSPFASALGMAAAAGEAEARGQEPVLMPQSPFANALGVAAEVAAASAAAEAAAAAAAGPAGPPAAHSQAPSTLRSEEDELAAAAAAPRQGAPEPAEAPEPAPPAYSPLMGSSSPSEASIPAPPAVVSAPPAPAAAPAAVDEPAAAPLEAPPAAPPVAEAAAAGPVQPAPSAPAAVEPAQQPPSQQAPQSASNDAAPAPSSSQEDEQR